MSDKPKKVVIHAGAIDWSRYVGKSQAQPTSIVPKSSADRGRATGYHRNKHDEGSRRKNTKIARATADTCIKSEDSDDIATKLDRAQIPSSSRITAPMRCVALGLLFFAAYVVYFESAAQSSLSENLGALQNVMFATVEPDPLRQPIADLGHCVQKHLSFDLQQLSAPSRNMVHSEHALRKMIDYRVAPACASAQSNPEHCNTIHRLWNALNATRATSEDAFNYSQILTAAVADMGAAIKSALGDAQTKLDEAARDPTGLQDTLGYAGFKWAQSWAYDLFGEPGNEQHSSLTFKYDRDQDQKDQEAYQQRQSWASTVRQLESCQEMQRNLSISVQNHRSRLQEFLGKASTWSNHPERWVSTKGTKAMACKAEDDAGGVEGLCARIGRDASVAWSDAVVAEG